MSPENTINAYYNLSANTIASQSILDVFVLQDIIDQEDANRLRQKFRTNREIENFLISNKIVTADTINKAYSIILKLPYIDLKNVEIPAELKKMMPEKLLRKYFFIPFSIEEKMVRIAIAKPADLLVGFKDGLGKIFADKGLDVEIFITGLSDFTESIKQYSSSKDKLLVKTGSLPVVYLRNQVISDEFLNKIPLDFVEKYRLTVFGQNRQGYFLVACEMPDSPVTIKILDFIKRENGIKIEKFATSKEDIDFILNTIKKVKQPVLETEKTETKKEITSSNDTDQGRGGIKNILNSLFDSSGPEITFDKDLSPIVPENRETLSAKEIALDQAVSATTKSTIPPIENVPIISENAPLKLEEKPIEVPESADESVINRLEDKDIGSLIQEEITTLDQLQKATADGSIPKIVAAIINYAINNRSSDIHVEPESKVLRIRCRIDGILKDVIKLPLKYQPPFISRVKILSKLKIDEARIPQDGRFDVTFKSRQVDVRVSTLPTVHGEKLVMRILDKSQATLSLEDLGMQGSVFSLITEAIKKPYGIILSTGPTGSGKSTTLYAVLNRISLPGVNIVTLEDPVEYEIAGINQCQIKPEIGFTFASGLRSILRQDPNIIMVGEIRDAETADMTTHAALTGHLVLSTLHTNDAAGALPRLINMGVEPFLITSAMNLIVAQRLVRRICPKCKEEMKVPQKLMDQLKVEIDRIPATNTLDRERIPAEMKLYYGKGCSECDNGFVGRVGIYEAMTISPEIEELVIGKEPANVIKDAAIKAGMITMKQDGIIKAFNGITTIDEVFQAVINS